MTSTQADRSELEQILDHTTAVVFLKDTEGRFLFVNRRFMELFGRGRQPVGQLDADLFPPEVAEAFHINDRAVLEQRLPLEFEETVVQDGATRVYLTTKFPLVDASGRPYAVCGFATDITERKRMEEALRGAALAVSTAGSDKVFQELVRHLATILDTDLAFIAVTDPEAPGMMRMLAFYVDGSISENIQYPMAGTPCETIFGQHFRIYPSGVSTRFPADAEFRRLGIEGYAGYPLNDPAGRPLGIISVTSRRPLDNPQFVESVLKIFAVRAAAEIERARADEALRVSEASYRAIFEASEDAIFVHDWDTGAIVDVNPKACAAYGYTYEELLTARVEDLSSGVPPYTQEYALQLMNEVKGGKPLSVEWHRRNKDGSLHWDEVFLRPAVIAGRPRIVAVTREITARKLAEEALRASEEQYRAIFNSSLDGLLVVTTDGVPVDANPAFLALFGYERDSLLDMKSEDLLAPPDRALGVRLLQEARAGKPVHAECRGRRSDGTVIDVEVRGVSMHYQGRPHFLFIARDITDRKRAEAQRAQLEAQLRQAQKMEAIGQLTGGIAHDFNNILTSIMGYQALAAERPAVAEDAKLAGYLEQAESSARRARDLIRQMLTFSRGHRGEMRPLALPEAVRESLKLLASVLPSTIELSAELDQEVPPVMLDPVQGAQVLMNLCLNARDAMLGAGSLRLAVRRARELRVICASCRQPVSGEFVELSVRDSGPGIAPEVLERMFEPFFTTKEVGKGTGMGLAMVHGIVHEHRGHILVHSAAGGGAEFRILYPALSEAAEHLAHVQHEPAPARPARRLAGRVLVADDESAILDFMRELLGGWGLEVVTAGNGADARAAFLQDPRGFDLVISDQTMPRMTGLELARHILALRPDLPVLLYTGYSDGLTEQDTAAAGVRALLRKPLEVAELLDLLKHHLAQE